MYDEGYSQYKAEKSFHEYQKDPQAWTKKTDAKIRCTWIGFTILYISLITFVIYISFPTAEEANSWLRRERVQFYLPPVCAVFGLSMYALKTRSLWLFGATELAFSLASAYTFKDHVVKEGIASWVAGVAVVYLFAKGFENIHKGLREIIQHKSETAQEAATTTTSAA